MPSRNLNVCESSPYTPRDVRARRNPVVRIGMTIAEMVIWLAVMALLSIGVIWLLCSSSR
ncbi:hypothetical protein Corgl_1585 [Coriobacterium glomerans PW2]|uniref:Uncharacterized protein n=1 Tax=Coriobacterium glomerans (strain ATCC 49209 / DSM 20642 / JCM 10262 / PW2) TaxID=700015 RepID=F2NB06_CORGP|nr:hypothetical protein [Coriobacterium glomerans]AEB07684.1 hypothetical protein Corgl_1585 [Coriobacterium glomerans PW2]